MKKVKAFPSVVLSFLAVACFGSDCGRCKLADRMPVAKVLLPVIPQPQKFFVEDKGEACDMMNAKVEIKTDFCCKLGEEGYKLEVDGNEIEVQAGGKTGFVRAQATLDQLKAAAKRGEKIPHGTIVDRPKYRMRGVVIDVARKFHSLDFLKRMARAMSLYKMNVLHIHLNDCAIEKNPKADWSTKYAAFRLESTKFPQLTSKDGFYTKKDFRNFIKWCDTIGVTVIPEIDSPAHALAFDRAFGLGSEWYGKDHLDLVNRLDECVDKMTQVLAEYLAGPDPVFANHYCHIGTDEYSKAAAEQFRAYTDRMIKAVEGMGGKVCMWGALTHAKGKTPVKASKDIIVDIWHNPYYQPQEALDAGYSLVSVPDGLVYLVPLAGYYYNYLNLKHLYNNWEPNEFGQGFKIPADHPQLMGGGSSRFGMTFAKIAVTRRDHGSEFSPLSRRSGRSSGVARSKARAGNGSISSPRRLAKAMFV